jgi:hypothetical protein
MSEAIPAAADTAPSARVHHRPKARNDARAKSVIAARIHFEIENARTRE